ncbi:hypothetical protein J4558_12105 [Leptolyngbya sp. 15MV]|nr:hypothetical protein J4558_12105 [Leptolyngbya sp. 15MV]
MKTKVLTAATLLAVAGHAVAQPTINGQLDASFYGNAPLWVQNQPTSRGDNTSTGSCVPCNIGTPAGVTTGIEWSIPLASIGNPSTSNIKLTMVIAGDSWQFLSNQITGGLPCPTTELGIARTVNLSGFSGNQYVSGIQTSATAPVVDGTLDAAYGQALFLQTNRTGFGDSSLGQPSTANGSEMNSAYAVVNGDRLYVFLPGNLATDFTRVLLFVDSLPGVGQNVMRNDNPDISFNRLNGLGPDPNNPSAGPGLTFDADFAADFVFTVTGNGSSTFTDYARLRDVPTPGDPGVGFYVGAGAYQSGAALTGGNAGADPVAGTLVTVDNRNTAGVLGNCQPASNAHVAVGSEIDGLYGRIFNDKLYVLLTGNLANNFDKVQFFIDAVPGGQTLKPMHQRQ